MFWRDLAGGETHPHCRQRLKGLLWRPARSFRINVCVPCNLTQELGEKGVHPER